MRIQILLLLLLISACSISREATLNPARQAAPAAGAVAGELTPIQRRLVEGAERILGRKVLIVRGKRFNTDCTGTILAIYYYAGIDLARNFNRYQGGGVTRLYRSLEEAELLYTTMNPVPGDIIFWDNTWDRNRDGKWNDPLTHAGMVVRVRKDGLIEYIHAHYREGIVIEHMNLRRPDQYQKLAEGKIIIVNAPMRMRQPGQSHPPKWLSSHLYRVFGMGYLFVP